MLEEIMDNPHKEECLSKWELEFVENLYRLGGGMTDAQEKKLEGIYNNFSKNIVKRRKRNASTDRKWKTDFESGRRNSFKWFERN